MLIEYEKQVEIASKELADYKKRRNVMTIIKVITFLAIFFEIYQFAASQSTLHILLMVASLCGFVACSFLDTRLVEKIEFLKALIKSYRSEIEYLKGNYSGLSTGVEFTDASHDYASDLDIFGEESLYQAINRTVTDNGGTLLASSLLTPCKDAEYIKARREASGELSKLNEWCHRFRAVGLCHPISSVDNRNISKWGEVKQFFAKSWQRSLLYGSNALMLIFFTLSFFYDIFLGLTIVLFLIHLFLTIHLTKRVNRVHGQLGAVTRAIGNYFYLINEIKQQSFDAPLLKTITNNLFGEKNALKIFKELQHILDSLDGRFNVFTFIFLNGFYMRDLYVILRLNRWKQKYINLIPSWIEQVSEIDMLISMANFRYNNPTYIEPTINSSSVLRTAGLGHPLLRSSKMITNDFSINELHNLYIVTGANMAGKSTFLRAVGVNMVLALSGNVVCAKSFECAPTEMFSSMRTTDNLAKGTSYFHAELLRLKALIDKASTGQPVFIILDEMLKGTNSVDKLNGSRRFLVRLLSLPVSGLVATHDLDLGKLADEYPNNFFNACFEIEHSNSDIIYDYKLKKRVSQNMNASILLENMGLV